MYRICVPGVRGLSRKVLNGKNTSEQSSVTDGETELAELVRLLLLMSQPNLKGLEVFDVPVVEVAFREDVGIIETSLVDRKIEDTGPLFLMSMTSRGRRTRRLNSGTSTSAGSESKVGVRDVEVSTISPDTSTTSADALAGLEQSLGASPTTSYAWPSGAQAPPSALLSRPSTSRSRPSTSRAVETQPQESEAVPSQAPVNPPALEPWQQPGNTRFVLHPIWDKEVLFIFYYKYRNHVTYIICCFQLWKVLCHSYAIQAYILVVFGCTIRLLDHSTSDRSGHVDDPDYQAKCDKASKNRVKGQGGEGPSKDMAGSRSFIE
ncbi:hypothetical protein M9H77_27316 [Catharanthus roseus]|uniref:Uncharacterized protein n=1 Tax=Catharanthus roseus TaxID=4058 RepID=A0ACC0AGE8_CATRO|nr:hypothetical protein M9H77_27316 [Catharanthus roseus]